MDEQKKTPQTPGFLPPACVLSLSPDGDPALNKLKAKFKKKFDKSSKASDKPEEPSR